MRPVCAELFTTSRCDNSCDHCLARSSHPGDADFADVERHLYDLAQIGVPYVDFTGGNPLLCEWIVAALRLSNWLGLYSSLTVSGPQITKRGPDFIGLPSLLRFSIDGAEEAHNAIRGKDYYRHIVNGLEMAQVLRQGKKTQLIFTAMPGPSGNIDKETLESVLKLARQFHVLVNVNTLFGATLTKAESQLLIRFAHQADVQVSRGRLRFMARGGNNTVHPTCRAASSVVTITSDSLLALPCYHQQVATFPLTDKFHLQDALNDERRRWLVRRQGRLPCCEGCSIWCYIIPSWVEVAPIRLVAWLHALSGLQGIRDPILRIFGGFHQENKYPDFKL